MVMRGFISNYANAVASSKNRKKKGCISRKLLIQIKQWDAKTSNQDQTANTDAQIQTNPLKTFTSAVSMTF